MKKLFDTYTELSEKEIMDYFESVLGIGPFFDDLSAAKDVGEKDAKHKIIKVSIMDYRKDRL